MGFGTGRAMAKWANIVFKERGTCVTAVSPTPAIAREIRIS